MITVPSINNFSQTFEQRCAKAGYKFVAYFPDTAIYCRAVLKKKNQEFLAYWPIEDHRTSLIEHGMHRVRFVRLYMDSLHKKIKAPSVKCLDDPGYPLINIEPLMQVRALGNDNRWKNTSPKWRPKELLHNIMWQFERSRWERVPEIFYGDFMRYQDPVAVFVNKLKEVTERGLITSQIADKMFDVFNDDQVGHSLQHGDLLPHNLFYNEENLWVRGGESAHWGRIGYDVAHFYTHIVINYNDEKFAKNFLERASSSSPELLSTKRRARPFLSNMAVCVVDELLKNKSEELQRSYRLNWLVEKVVTGKIDGLLGS